MKTVCMYGSFRHYDEMVAFRDALLASGASCEWPTPDLRRDPTTMTQEDNNLKEVRDAWCRFTQGHRRIISGALVSSCRCIGRRQLRQGSQGQRHIGVAQP